MHLGSAGASTTCIKYGSVNAELDAGSSVSTWPATHLFGHGPGSGPPSVLADTHGSPILFIDLEGFFRPIDVRCLHVERLGHVNLASLPPGIGQQ